MDNYVLPNVNTITFEVSQEPVPCIKFRSEGQIIGILRKLKGGQTFTSDEVGSLILDGGTQCEGLVGIIADFFKSREAEWNASQVVDEDTDEEE